MIGSWRVAASAALLALTLFAVFLAGKRSPQELARPLESIAETVGEWRAEGQSKLDEETETVLKASDYDYRVYGRGNERLDVFVAFYAMQQSGEAMHSPKNCLPGSGWEIWNYDTVPVAAANGSETVNKYWIQRGRDRMLVLYWYQSRRRVIASEYAAKVYLVWDALTTGDTSGSIVRITLPDHPEAEKAALEFASKLIPLVHDVLPAS